VCALLAAHAAAHVENRVEVAAHLGNMGAVAAAEGAEQVDAHGYKAGFDVADRVTSIFSAGRSTVRHNVHV